MTPTQRRLGACGCLALSMSLVGSYVALSKPLAAAIPVLLLAWLRFGIGGLAMLHWLRKPVDEPPLTRRTRWLLFLESLFGNFLFSLCMLFGVGMTSAVSAGVIMAAIPAAVAALSWFLLGERADRRTVGAIVLSMTGIGFLAWSKDGPDAAPGLTWLGNLLIFGAVLCEAAYAVIGKQLTGALGARRITALINLWGFALITPLGLYTAMRFDFAAPTGGIWLLLLFYSLAASVWTVWLWMTGLRHVPASRAGVFTVMLPVSAALVGVFALGEPFDRYQALALVTALAGVVLATLPFRKPVAGSR